MAATDTSVLLSTGSYLGNKAVVDGYSGPASFVRTCVQCAEVSARPPCSEQKCAERSLDYYNWIRKNMDSVNKFSLHGRPNIRRPALQAMPARHSRLVI